MEEDLGYWGSLACLPGVSWGFQAQAGGFLHVGKNFTSESLSLGILTVLIRADGEGPPWWGAGLGVLPGSPTCLEHLQALLSMHSWPIPPISLGHSAPQVVHNSSHLHLMTLNSQNPLGCADLAAASCKSSLLPLTKGSLWRAPLA